MVDQTTVAVESWLGIAAMVALVGLAVLTIESRIVAAALLGGAALDRPLTLREAIRRSRQTFWRVVRAFIIVQIPLGIVGQVLASVLAGAGTVSEATTLASTVVTTLIGAPFVYALAGIVLGDVAAFESVRRSVRLARVRWRLAILASILGQVSQYVLVFGLGAGVDLLARVWQQLGLSLDSGSATILPAVVFVMVAVTAVGSLLFTVSALAVAPQVVAFLGLTHYGSGLDRARAGANVPHRVRWLTIPMAIGIGLSVFVGLAGVASVVGS